MKKNIKYIDEEEKNIIESYNNIDLEALTHPSTKDQEEIKNIAKKFLKKETKMNIRIDPYELEKIKECAENEGLKYQSFIKSVMHKYITGQLIEKKFIINK